MKFTNYSMFAQVEASVSMILNYWRSLIYSLIIIIIIIIKSKKCSTDLTKNAKTKNWINSLKISHSLSSSGYIYLFILKCLSVLHLS